MRVNFKLILTMVVAVAFCVAGMANATNLISFNPAGTGTTGELTNVALFDWAPGSALALGGNPAGGLFTGSSITLLFQANLSAIDAADTSIIFANGTDGIYFTAVAGFAETASVSGATATFSPDLSQPSFFYIYANSALSDNLNGTGFTSGQIILKGSMVASDFDSSFTVTSVRSGIALDESPNGNQWVGTTTVRGVGSSDITMSVDWVDPDYFPSMGDGITIDFSFFNTSQVDPFNQVDPSKYMSSNGIANADTAANVGSVNGGYHATGSDYNFIFQADANQSFSVVPEPSTLLLFGCGLVGLVAWKKKN